MLIRINNLKSYTIDTLQIESMVSDSIIDGEGIVRYYAAVYFKSGNHITLVYDDEKTSNEKYEEIEKFWKEDYNALPLDFNNLLFPFDDVPKKDDTKDEEIDLDDIDEEHIGKC